MANWNLTVEIFLKSILIDNVGMEDEDVTDFLNHDDIFNMFSDALTHKTQNYTYNYEKYEFLGDRIVNELIVQDLIIKNPKLSEDKINNMANYYKSNEFFATIEMSKDLLNIARFGDSHKYLQQDNDLIKQADSADLLEAFFGALKLSGEYISSGLGSQLTQNLFVSIFVEEMDKDENKHIGSSKTNVLQLYDQFKHDTNLRAIADYVDIDDPLGPIINPTVTKREGITQGKYNLLITFDRSIVYITYYLIMMKDNLNINDAMTKFNEVFEPTITPTGFIIERSDGEVFHKRGEAILYDNIMEKFNQLGITLDDTKQYKFMLEKSNAILSGIVQAADQAFISAGYDSWEYTTDSKILNVSQSTIIMLIGVRENGDKKIVKEIIVQKKNRLRGVKELLEIFIEDQ